MKRYDPIEHHTNGPGWSWAHDSVMRECEDGQWVRREDAERDLAKMRAALETVANARTLDEAKWAANTALATTTSIPGVWECGRCVHVQRGPGGLRCAGEPVCATDSRPCFTPSA